MTNIILEPHQIQAKNFLMKTPHACLFFEARGGKTYPTVESILELVPKGKILILAPKKAKVDMWDIMTEYKLPKNTLILNFESAITNNWAPKLLQIKWDVVIVDECHKIKSHKSKIGKLCQKLTKNVKYAWGLTGTPRDKSDVEVTNIFRNLNIGDFGKMSYSKFTETYCSFNMAKYGNRVFFQPTDILPQHKKWWEGELEKYSIVYNLPEKNKQLKNHIVNIKGMENEHYTNAENNIIELGDYEDTLTRGAAMMKAHQASNGHIIIEGQIHKFMDNKKIQWLKDFMSKTDKQGIVTYKFIADRLALLEIDGVTLDYQEFRKGEKQILLLQSSQSMGFDCSNADFIIFYTMSHGYIDFNQIWHRLINIKKTTPIDLYYLFNTKFERGVYNSIKLKHTGHTQFMTIREEVMKD